MDSSQAAVNVLKAMDTYSIKRYIIVDLEDCKSDKINAANIANFLLEQVLDETYFQKPPFILNV